jgi:hypothetical protein
VDKAPLATRIVTRSNDLQAYMTPIGLCLFHSVTSSRNGVQTMAKSFTQKKLSFQNFVLWPVFVMRNCGAMKQFPEGYNLIGTVFRKFFYFFRTGTGTFDISTSSYQQQKRRSTMSKTFIDSHWIYGLCWEYRLRPRPMGGVYM